MAPPGESAEALFRRAQSVTPGGVHSPVRAFRRVGGVPFFTRRASGAYLEDSDGRRLLDFCMAFGPLILGHAHPAVREAAGRAIGDGWSYGTAEPYSLELAELIASRIPWAGSMRFVSSGTEAVMTALRLARGVTGRAQILKFDGCYHGHADAMLISAGSGLATAGVPDSAGVPPGVANDTLVSALDDEAALEALFERSGSMLAAAIIEPLPANFGLLPQRTQFIARLRELCTRHRALLIFDEVITGFRLAFGGYAEASGVVPDLVTYGKIIGGGFPVGAVAGPRDLMQYLAPAGPVYQAGTLSANPVAMRAGLAMLRELASGGVYGQLEESGALLESLLDAAGMHVQRVASIFWVPGAPRLPAVIRRSAGVTDSITGAYPGMFHALLAQGIYLPPSPFEVGFLSAAHSAAHVRQLADAIVRSRR